MNETAPNSPAWQPLTKQQRRVLGTLLEKAKTTPDVYPMTIAGLTTGCNQKSNREPIMNLSQDQVEEITEQLRDLGAVTLVQGNGRVPKIRHYAYQWFGINAPEAAVMTELLLRGDQTVGELRQRASRMEPIADLGTLHQILDGLHKRSLVVYLTPSGRGQVVSHSVYRKEELDALQQKYKGYTGSELDDSSDDEPAYSHAPAPVRNAPAAAVSHAVSQPPFAQAAAPQPANDSRLANTAQAELDQLKQLLQIMQTEIGSLRGEIQSLTQRIVTMEQLLQ